MIAEIGEVKIFRFESTSSGNFTVVKNDQFSVPNNPEDCSSFPLFGGNLKSRLRSSCTVRVAQSEIGPERSFYVSIAEVTLYPPKVL